MQTSTTNLKPQKIQPQLNNQFGRQAPQAIELENKVLGILMEFNGAWDTVSEYLKTDSFYNDTNKRIFEAISILAAKKFGFEVIGVVNQLTRDGNLEAVGGAYEVMKKTNAANSMVGLDGYCKIITEKYILREIIRMNGELIDLAFDPAADAFQVLDFAETKIFDLSVNSVSNDFSDLNSEMIKVVKHIEELQKQTEDITGVPSDFIELDNITHGWQKTDFIVLAARPSVGKSAFALNLARNAAMHKTKPTSVGFFSLEMNTSQLVERILSAQSEVWLDRFKTGKMEEYHMKILYKKGILALENAKIFIDDTAGLTIQQLRAKCRRMVMKENVGLVIIDYLQLMRSSVKSGGNREQEISNISREIKILAKELKIPIIALSQLSREIEKRAIKTPVLSDLRESGGIEQDADIVGFIYRPSVEDRKNDDELKTTAMVSIAKHRNGALVDLVFNVDDNIQKWKEVGILGKFKDNLTPVKSLDYSQSQKEQDDTEAPF